MSENKRLTWCEIAKRYPDQWVGLTEAEYEPDNDATIKSAVVTYTDKSKEELTIMTLKSNGKISGCHTSPNGDFQLGALGV